MPTRFKIAMALLVISTVTVLVVVTMFMGPRVKLGVRLELVTVLAVFFVSAWYLVVTRFLDWRQRHH